MVTHSLASPRSAQWALVGGIAFSAVFVGLIAVLDPWLARFVLPPDEGPFWYYWQLANPTLLTRATAWGMYSLHQVTLWGLIYYAQKNVNRYTPGLHPINLLALALNAGFIIVHLLQTHLWYDGLAQDVSSSSSQYSVVLLLVWVLLMENPRRGLVGGKRAPIAQQVISFARKYHGYVFAWGITYTFWFHPMVSTPGHLIGFFYMFLLLLQSSLFFTRLHINRWWTLVQEVTVLFHGSVVAYIQNAELWPMFAFGFAGIFILTQMHGLGWPRWVKGLLALLYVAGVVWVYAGRGFNKLDEIIRIPVIEYVSVVVLALILLGGLWIAKRLRGPEQV